MIQLKDFLLTASEDNALALNEAQAHPEESYSLITSDTMSSLLIKSGLYSYVMDALPAQEIRRVTADRITAGGRFDFDPSTTLGADNISLFGYMMQLEANEQTRTDEYKLSQLQILQGLIDNEAVITSLPFENITLKDVVEARDVGEIIKLDANPLQHEYQINTTNQPLKPTDIIIEHRFGTDTENLTDWFEIGRIREVYYPTTMTGSPYKSGQVAASHANVRELRLVSPLTLGVSLP
jgi:hypothetical protein